MTPTTPAYSTSSHPMIVKTASAGRSLVLLLIRLAWGFETFQSGWGHLHNVPTMVENFKEWHVPFPHLSVYMSGITEVVCGLLLMAGFFSRLITIPLIFNFIVAIFTPHTYIKDLLKTPGVSDSWTNIVNDTAFPFLAVSLVILAFGPGKISVDYLMQRTTFRNFCAARHLVLETKPLGKGLEEEAHAKAQSRRD